MKEADLIAGERASGLFEGVEEIVITAVNWLRLGLEVIGALIVAIGTVIAVTLIVRAVLRYGRGDFHTVRLVFARYLSLALEFQLGADILSTAVAPSWSQIGKLAAIAIIRTALNYFLMLEMRAEEASSDDETRDKDPLSEPEREEKLSGQRGRERGAKRDLQEEV